MDEEFRFADSRVLHFLLDRSAGSSPVSRDLGLLSCFYFRFERNSVGLLFTRSTQFAPGLIMSTKFEIVGRSEGNYCEIEKQV